MININDVSKSFGTQEVLKNITLELHGGQSIALIGPNGSGKTTLIKSILDLVKIDSGQITVTGQDITEGCGYRKNIGYMPQNSSFPDNMRVGQLIRMLRKIRHRFPADRLDMEMYENFEIDRMKRKFLKELSGGMGQKVNAAIAFLFDPPVLILDEPTAGLDPVSNEMLKEKINKSVRAGKLVFITSHVLSDLDEVTTQVIYLMDGKVAFFKDIHQLKQETSETKLNKIIASIIRREFSYAKS